MNIICTKCKYILSNGQVTVHLIAAIVQFIHTIRAYWPQTKSMMTDMKIKAEKILLSCANILEIRCPQCYKYEYWTYSENINLIEQTK